MPFEVPVSLAELSPTEREKVLYILSTAPASEFNVDNDRETRGVCISLTADSTHPIMAAAKRVVEQCLTESKRQEELNIISQHTAPNLTSSARYKDPSVVVSVSPVKTQMGSRILRSGRRGQSPSQQRSQRMRSRSRSASPGRSLDAPKSVQWTSKLVEEIMNAAVKANIDLSNRRGPQDLLGFVQLYCTNRSGVSRLVQQTMQDLLKYSNQFRAICPLCAAFHEYATSNDERGAMEEFLLVAEFRNNALPYLAVETQKTVLPSGEGHIVMRRYVPLNSVLSLVKKLLRGRASKATYAKQAVATWINQGMESSIMDHSQSGNPEWQPLAFDNEGHVDAIEMFRIMAAAIRGSHVVDGLAAKPPPEAFFGTPKPTPQHPSKPAPHRAVMSPPSTPQESAILSDSNVRPTTLYQESRPPSRDPHPAPSIQEQRKVSPPSTTRSEVTSKSHAGAKERQTSVANESESIPLELDYEGGVSPSTLRYKPPPPFSEIEPSGNSHDEYSPSQIANDWKAAMADVEPTNKMPSRSSEMYVGTSSLNQTIDVLQAAESFAQATLRGSQDRTMSPARKPLAESSPVSLSEDEQRLMEQLQATLEEHHRRTNTDKSISPRRPLERLAGY